MAAGKDKFQLGSYKIKNKIKNCKTSILNLIFSMLSVRINEHKCRYSSAG